MKHLFTFLLCMFLASPAHAWHLVQRQTVSGSPPSDYDATYDFEGTDPIGTGTLANWAISSGTPDPNASTAGLDMEGTYCLQLNPTDTIDLFFVTDTDATKYVTLKFRWDDDLESNEVGIFAFRWGTTNLATYGFREGLDEFALRATGGTLRFGGSWSAGVSQYIKMFVQQGSGANTIARMWYSSNGTTWVEVGEASVDGTEQFPPLSLRINNSADTENLYIDYVIENETDIPNASN